MEPMQLKDYPQAIADLEKELIQIDRRISAGREQVAICLNVIDRQIAFNQELKNDAQRKAKRTELMETDADYITVSLELKKAEAVRAELEVDLNLLTRTFSILKLERREAIARMEVNSSLVA